MSKLLSKFIKDVLRDVESQPIEEIEFDLGISDSGTSYREDAHKVMINDNSTNRLRFTVKLKPEGNHE